MPIPIKSLGCVSDDYSIVSSYAGEEVDKVINAIGGFGRKSVLTTHRTGDVSVVASYTVRETHFCYYDLDSRWFISWKIRNSKNLRLYVTKEENEHIHTYTVWVIQYRTYNNGRNREHVGYLFRRANIDLGDLREVVEEAVLIRGGELKTDSRTYV